MVAFQVPEGTALMATAGRGGVAALDQDSHGLKGRQPEGGQYESTLSSSSPENSRCTRRGLLNGLLHTWILKLAVEVKSGSPSFVLFLCEVAKFLCPEEDLFIFALISFLAIVSLIQQFQM